MISHTPQFLLRVCQGLLHFLSHIGFIALQCLEVILSGPLPILVVKWTHRMTIFPVCLLSPALWFPGVDSCSFVLAYSVAGSLA